METKSKKKIIFISILILLGLATTTWFILGSKMGKNVVEKEQEDGSSFSERETQFQYAAKTDDQGAVSIEVAPKELGTGKEQNIFDISFNTHSVELDYDFSKIIVLKDENGVEYPAIEWRGESGGHHISGSIVFGKFPDETRKIHMEIREIEGLTRAFEWDLLPVVEKTDQKESGLSEKKEEMKIGFDTATIYYNEACGMCASYMNSELPKVLEKYGVKNIIKKDYINERENRAKMNDSLQELVIPLDMQSHIMALIGDKYVLGGHIPEAILHEVFAQENQEKFKRIAVYQDEMHEAPEDYRIFAIPSYADTFVGEPQTYPIGTSIKEYFDFLKQNKDSFLQKKNSEPSLPFNGLQSFLPMVIVSGFLDGINPCAFAVLLFFIALLFSLKRSRSNIWKMGVVYIVAIYLAYLSIGLGLMQAILFVNSPHFMAKLGAWLVIALGAINLIGYYFPKFPIKLKIPQASKETLEHWMVKATLPAAFVLGFLVGLCTFPCSGGIYVAIIGFLAAKTTYWKGMGYLLLYNFMFIVPLIVVLLLSSNAYAVEKLTTLEQSQTKFMRLLSAVVMIALGVVILVWFT